MAEHRLDARGLQCPLPVLRARKALKALQPGETLLVLATDPGAPKDFAAFCLATGDRLRETAKADEGYRILVEKGGGAGL